MRSLRLPTAVGFVQKDDEHWGEHAKAHAMVTGYQAFGSKELKDYRRHLVELAASDVLKTPATLRDPIKLCWDSERVGWLGNESQPAGCY